MERAAWLAERRSVVEADYTRDASTYDEGYDPVTAMHRSFVTRLIATVPSDGSLLDAPCGTAPYASIVLEAGRRYVGADQSAGMLDQARLKHPDLRFEHLGLQELAFDRDFDAAMCVDAMEHVPPEEWPLVVGNLHRAIHPRGHLYLTVEETQREQHERAHEATRAAGVPAVYGEHIERGTGGYHFYPDRERIDAWLSDAGFQVVEVADEPLDGYGYYHLLVRKGEVRR